MTNLLVLTQRSQPLSFPGLLSVADVDHSTLPFCYVQKGHLLLSPSQPCYATGTIRGLDNFEFPTLTVQVAITPS